MKHRAASLRQQSYLFGITVILKARQLLVVGSKVTGYNAQTDFTQCGCQFHVCLNEYLSKSSQHLVHYLCCQAVRRRLLRIFIARQHADARY